jgi:hypothetical protein
MARDVHILWNEGDWRCEMHTGATLGEARLLVYRGDLIVSAESVHRHAAAYARGEMLRLRVLLGICAADR